MGLLSASPVTVPRRVGAEMASSFSQSPLSSAPLVTRPGVRSASMILYLISDEPSRVDLSSVRPLVEKPSVPVR